MDSPQTSKPIYILGAEPEGLAAAYYLTKQGQLIVAIFQNKILQAFEKTGVKAVGSEEAVIPPDELGWQKLKSGVGYICFLNKA